MTVIDRLEEVAREMGADRKVVTLAELCEVYRKRYPSEPGSGEDSLAATLNMHTINMRSRFPNPREPKTPGPWLKRPLFKRVDRGEYRLLSEAELGWFREAIERDNPFIWRDEFIVPKVG
jgi:hypothetical protein